MNFAQLMEFSKWLETSGFTQYSVSAGGFHISMSKQDYNNLLGTSQISFGNDRAAMIPVDLPKEETAASNPAKSVAREAQAPMIAPAAASVEQNKEGDEGHIITSPIVGTYYESSSPEKPAFAKVGQVVKKGDVLCILEAMKIMNEITADADGTIAEIFVENGAMVEARQKLFRLV